jgi:hypothetical protein
MAARSRDVMLGGPIAFGADAGPCNSPPSIWSWSSYGRAGKFWGRLSGPKEDLQHGSAHA